MNLHSLRIATQLRLGFGILAVLIGVIAGISLTRITTIDESFDAVLEREYPIVVDLYGIERQVNDVARAVRNALLISDAAEVKKETDRIASSRQKIG